jgi:hypothetical protein
MSPFEPGPHADLLADALGTEAQAQRALLAGDPAAPAGFAAAAAAYRASWDLAPPRSFGRLVGMLKAALIAGGPDAAAEDARFALGALPDPPDSPAAAYATAIAALTLGDDAPAVAAAPAMEDAGAAFANAAAAVRALGAGDGRAYAAARAAIVRSFEEREEHLTGVAIADTAIMFDRLAAARSIEVPPGGSPVLPPG